MEEIRKSPFKMVLLSILLSSIGLWISYLTFRESASVLAIAFTTIGLIPIIHSLLKKEEAEEIEKPGPRIGFLKRHFDLIEVYAWFFIGMILTYSFWFAVLPEKTGNFCIINNVCIQLPTRNDSFKEQEKAFTEIQGLKAELSGNATETAKSNGNIGKTTNGIKGNIGETTDGINENNENLKEINGNTNKNSKVANGEFSEISSGENRNLGSYCGRDAVCFFNAIFVNNALVLLFAIILSIALGAGAIFLIAWNASIIGVVIGRDVLSLIGTFSSLGSFNIAGAYLTALVFGLRFLPHGIPEIVAYFLGAIAGGLLSIIITKKEATENEMTTMLIDIVLMVAVAIALLFAAAWIEALIIVL